ncbi:MAG: hypothetical protein LUF85_08135 [Bacteroides sp.]|nr:hypothetical protein [Bacteroides sp.]
MKRKLCIALFLGICALFHGQEVPVRKNSPLIPARKQLQLEFTTGATFDRIHRGSDPNAAYFGSKKSTTPLLGFRITHLFSDKMGWYIHTQFNFYEHKSPEKYPPHITEELWKEFMKWTFGLIHYHTHPSFEAGWLYRIEQQRWRLHPHIGFGYAAYLPNVDRKKTITSQGNIKTSHYKQHVNTMIMDVGFSVNYYLTGNTYLLVNANYQQPLQKSYARLTTTVNEVETEHIYYKVSTAGRNINTQVGIGFCLWRKDQ